MFVGVWCEESCNELDVYVVAAVVVVVVDVVWKHLECICVVVSVVCDVDVVL